MLQFEDFDELADQVQELHADLNVDIFDELTSNRELEKLSNRLSASLQQWEDAVYNIRDEAATVADFQYIVQALVNDNGTTISEYEKQIQVSEDENRCRKEIDDLKQELEEIKSKLLVEEKKLSLDEELYGPILKHYSILYGCKLELIKVVDNKCEFKLYKQSNRSIIVEIDLVKKILIKFDSSLICTTDENDELKAAYERRGKLSDFLFALKEKL